MSAELKKAIAVVQRALAAAEKEIGTGGGRDHWTRRKEVMTRCAEELTANVGARINDRWNGCSVRIAGVSSTCTAGMSGALKNWMTAARRKLTSQPS